MMEGMPGDGQVKNVGVRDDGGSERVDISGWRRAVMELEVFGL